MSFCQWILPGFGRGRKKLLCPLSLPRTQFGKPLSCPRPFPFQVICTYIHLISMSSPMRLPSISFASRWQCGFLQSNLSSFAAVNQGSPAKHFFNVNEKYPKLLPPSMASCHVLFCLRNRRWTPKRPSQEAIG